MINNENKMPASFAEIDENEMEYLQGGAEAEGTVDAWQVFQNFGTLFNLIARVFSAGSSIVNNVVVIVNTIGKLNSFTFTGKN